MIDSDTYIGHVYKLLSPDTWTASENFASGTLGSHLVTVNDAAENNWLISRFGSDKALWLGLHRTYPHSTTFVWSSGEAVTYTNWAANEPNDCILCNNDPNGEQFTQTYTSGQWNDLGESSGGVGPYGEPKYGVVEIIPEPTTYAVILAGLGLLGTFAKRRKRGSCIFSKRRTGVQGT